MKTTLVSAILAMALVPCSAIAQAPERPNRPDRSDRTNRPERPAERPNHPERPNRHDRPTFDAMWERHDTDGDGFLSRDEFNEMPRISRLPEEQQARLFERLDKDNDGKLSKEEMRMMRQPRDPQRPNPGMRRLMELDTDGSGGVSLEELRAGEMFSRMPAERQEALFRRLDTDGDGEITPKDRPEFPRGLMQPPTGERPERPEQRPDRAERPERPLPPVRPERAERPQPPARPDRAERPQPPVRPERPDRPQPAERPERPQPAERPAPPNPRVVFQRLDVNQDGSLNFREFRQAPGIARHDEDAQESLFNRLDRDNDKLLSPAEFAVIPMERLMARPQPSRPLPNATPRPERRPQPQQ